MPLCVLRALSGLGLAIAMPAAFGIVGSTFSSEPAKTIAFSAMSVGNPMGSIVGQLTGARIAESHPWVPSVRYPLKQS